MPAPKSGIAQLQSAAARAKANPAAAKAKPQPVRGGVASSHAAASSRDPPSAAPSVPSPVAGGIALRKRKAGGLAEAPTPKPYTKLLKRDWGKGKLSSPMVQQHAEAASQQGAHGLEEISAAGTSGRHPQNIQRSLVSIFGKPKGAPDFNYAQIPTSMGLMFHPFLYPHFFSLHFITSRLKSGSRVWKVAAMRFVIFGIR